MNYIYKTIFFIAGVALLSACEPKMNEFKSSAGSADFSKYIAIGNSLTAGYADNALYSSGQSYSYANIIGQQFMLAGGNAFVQPVVGNEDGLLAGKLKLGISLNCLGVSSLGPVSAAGTPTNIPAALAPVGYAVNNFGVPGAKSYHLIAPGYGNPAGLAAKPATANPYFVRFASSGTTTILADAMAANPTFFSLWIGDNDVLGYSTSGGIGDVITSQPLFTGALTSIITSLTAKGAKGIVANIPDVTSIPFFTTIPYNGLVLTRQGQVDSLNLAYHKGAIGISFKLGPNAFVIEDLKVPAKMRQIRSTEMVLLTLSQDLIRCSGYGSRMPIPDVYTLDDVEISNIQTAIQGFNQTLKTLAEAHNLAYVDMNALLKTVKTGMVYDGMRFSTTYVTGGVFSLDGIHYTPRGNAVVANYFIEAINGKYGASIPKVTIGDYPGIKFP